jgi:response regulator RpfG family c-di-GMP phosphodiesterase
VDGAALIRKIRESGNDVPILVMGARGAVDTVKAIREGAAGYLTKPINVEDVLAKVRKALRKALETPKPTRTIEIPLRELHDPETGRIDAKKLADFLAIPLAKLATSVDVLPATAHKSPSAPSLQEHLQPIKRASDLVMRATGSQRDARAWLNNPHPDLDGRTPLDVMLSGQADAVTTLLENALAGIPS